MADTFAENGFKTVIPDILNGDPVINFNDPNFDRDAWLARHTNDSWVEPVDKVVAALKAEGVTRIGTTGFCFGGPVAFYIAFKHGSHVTVVNHPARLAVPDDLEVGCPPSYALGTDMANSDLCDVEIQERGNGSFTH